MMSYLGHDRAAILCTRAWGSEIEKNDRAIASIEMSSLSDRNFALKRKENERICGALLLFV